MKHSSNIHILAHKTYLTKFIIEIIPSMFLDYNGIKLEINNRKIAAKTQNIWKLNILLNNTWVKKKKSQETLKISYIKYNLSKLEDTAKTVLRRKYRALTVTHVSCDICISCDTYITRRNIKNLSFHFRKLREKRNLNLVQTEEKIIKIRAEINETGKMKTIEKINKSKS